MVANLFKYVSKVTAQLCTTQLEVLVAVAVKIAVAVVIRIDG
jgi:hypothetical protein